MITTQLDVALGIVPSTSYFPSECKPLQVTACSPELDRAEDYEFVRNALRTTISAMSDNLDEITTLAKEAESPRAFEVAAATGKSLGDLAKQLMELHRETKQESKQEAQVIHNTQNIFSGTSADLLKMLKGGDV